jgi:quercetin dioxygenase-like cupin family protein
MEIKSLSPMLEFSEERFTKRIIHKKDDSVVFVLNFMPGQELPVHNHPGTAVYILVLAGAGDVIVNGEASAIAKDDTVWVDGAEQFAFKNTGSEQTTLYVMLAKIPDERFAQNV